MSKKLILFFFLVVAALGALYVRSEKVRANSANSAPSPQPQTAETQVVAYYFHVTARCATCRTIESYSREVIEQKFGALFTKSLVLVRFEKGRPAEYTVLNDTWELVGNKQAMQGYVEREVRDYLKRLS